MIPESTTMIYIHNILANQLRPCFFRPPTLEYCIPLQSIYLFFAENFLRFLDILFLKNIHVMIVVKHMPPILASFRFPTLPI